jgi:hypothetical protein
MKLWAGGSEVGGDRGSGAWGGGGTCTAPVPCSLARLFPPPPVAHGHTSGGRRGGSDFAAQTSQGRPSSSAVCPLNHPLTRPHHHPPKNSSHPLSDPPPADARVDQSSSWGTPIRRCWRTSWRGPIVRHLVSCPRRRSRRPARSVARARPRRPGSTANCHGQSTARRWTDSASAS